MGTIADKLEYLNQTKQEIKQAIIDKKQPVSADDPFRSYAAKIAAIKTENPVQNFAINAPTTVYGGQKTPITVTGIMPTDATISAVDHLYAPGVKWTSSNSEVIGVLQELVNGTVNSYIVPFNMGEATLTATIGATSKSITVQNIASAGNLTGLKAALDLGIAETVYPINSEAADTWNNVNNPWVVAQYYNGDGAYGTTPGVFLFRKYVAPESQKWDDSVTDYAKSSIYTYLKNTYPNNCTEEINSLAAEIDLPYYNGSQNTTCKAKYFLMSVTELMGTGKSTEGVAWEAWKQRTGLSSPSDSVNNGRIMNNPSGTAKYYWTRSWYLASHVYKVDTDGYVDTDAPYGPFGVVVACFIPKSP